MRNYLILRDENKILELVNNVLYGFNFVHTDIVKILYKNGYGYVSVRKRLGNQKHLFRFAYFETSKNIFNIYKIDTEKFGRGDKISLMTTLHDNGWLLDEIAIFFDMSTKELSKSIYRRNPKEKPINV